VSETREISFRLNGKIMTFRIRPGEKLAKLLRRSGFTGTKEGCDEGTCGACTVIMDGRAIMSCITLAFQAHGRDVWTIEGVGSFEKPHPIQRALIDEGAVQCGYCTPGMIMAAKALFDVNPKPSDEEIRDYTDGTLCRCTGYEKIWSALKKVRDGQ
jgi:aerobic carbon-monoxide dehydrogenase small subunit